MSRRWLSILSTVVAISVAPACYADVVPNPGTATVVTNSTTATATYVSASVSREATAYDTTITAVLSGTTVYNMEFALPFIDPMVQAAVAAADAVLAEGGAAYGTPSLARSTTTSSSSTVQATPPSLTCAQLISGSYTATRTTNFTTVTTFGPGTINVGTCLQDTFNILDGQIDININADSDYSVPVNEVTTTTTLTTQLYQITGFAGTQPPSTSVPEPATAKLLLTGLAVLGGVRRRR